MPTFCGAIQVEREEAEQNELLVGLTMASLVRSRSPGRSISAGLMSERSMSVILSVDMMTEYRF